MNAKGQINVTVPASQLWHILAEDYDKVGEWATAVEESTPNPDVPVGEGRVCATSFGNNKETITHMDEQEQSFSYAVEFAQPPFFLEGIENTWTIVPQGNDQSLVRMSANVHLKTAVAPLVAPFMKHRMEKGFDALLEELKYYAETGQVHPRKQEQFNSKKLQLV